MGNNSDGASGWFMSVYDSPIIFGADTEAGKSYIYTASPVSGWPNGHWNMVTVTRNGTNMPLLYINGELAALGMYSYFTGPSFSTNDLVFGTGAGGGVTSSQVLDGHIWLPQIRSSVLSPSDIANLYFIERSGNLWP